MERIRRFPAWLRALIFVALVVVFTVVLHFTAKANALRVMAKLSTPKADATSAEARSKDKTHTSRKQRVPSSAPSKR